MQDNYVSLNPSYAQSQALQDRIALWEKRYDEANGGPLANFVGTTSGLTASLFFYVRAQKAGFKGFFPLARLNAGHYALILGGGYVAYKIGSGIVQKVSGDLTYARYLQTNKVDIIYGKTSF